MRSLSKLSFVLLLAPLLVRAADAPKKTPYLGPGIDSMPADEYERVYKNYIQMSALLGYPFVEGSRSSCEHALRALFRQHGFFDYPVPGEAAGIFRKTFKTKTESVEFYENGGNLIQLLRDPKSGALDRLVLVNSSSPKASRRLSQYARQDVLALEKDPRTGLEKVHGLPVGYPHPFLSPEGQGLIFRELRFNKNLNACMPVAFTDNAWIGGFDLTSELCRETKAEVDAVWQNKLSPKDFAGRELARLRAKALRRAKEKGLSDEEARKLVDDSLSTPLTSEVSIVGASMRNLAQCNQLALTMPPAKQDGGTAEEGGNGRSGGSKDSAGSAK